MNIAGNVLLGGTVGVAWLGGFVPASGNSFNVLGYGSYSGVFTNTDFPMSRCEQKRTAVVSKSGQFVVSKSGRAIKSGLLLSPLVAQSRADTLGVLHRRIGLCGDATRAPTGGL